MRFRHKSINNDTPAIQEKDIRRAMITAELAVAVGGAALATAGIEQNVPGLVTAAALGTVAVILGKTSHEVMQVYRQDSVQGPDAEYADTTRHSQA